MPNHTIRRVYQRQKNWCKRKGVVFTISYDDFKSLWFTDFKWSQRGNGDHQYAMIRLNPRGGYTPRNVVICKRMEILKYRRSHEKTIQIPTSNPWSDTH